MSNNKEEPGRAAYSKGGYTPGDFSDVDSVEAFARKLRVPAKSIALVRPLNDPCKSKDCPFNAVLGNSGYCPAHRRTWYPLKHSRGGLLSGPEFVREKGSKRFRTCDCEADTCFLAGYFPSQDALYIPKDGIDTVLDTPGIMSEQKRQKIKDGEIKKVHLYPWHFFPDALEQDEHGLWQLKFDKKQKEQRWYDKERKTRYDFPPPRNVPEHFIEKIYYSSFVRPQDRWAQENSETSMPSWMLNMLALDGSSFSSSNTEASPTQLRRQVEMWKARSFYLRKEKLEQEERHAVELSSIRAKHNETIEKKDAEIKRLKESMSNLENETKELRDQLSSANHSLLEYISAKKAQPLRYHDLYDGGIMSHHVKAFTLFDTVEQNDAFLDILNFADGSEGSFPVGDGLCENLRVYSKVKREQRSGEAGSPSMDRNSEEYADWLRRSKAARMHGTTWKDDYLAWCLYARSGMTQEAAASLCGIESGRMSDVFHEWAQVLDQGLCEWFPRPTHSQMLQAYPTRFIESDGHARCYLLLDAFEIFTQTSSNPNVASSTHSDYKKHCTTKFLGGTDPIGCPWAATVPDGFPGKASDVLVTDKTKILRQVPFGHTTKVDKGFIVDNLAADDGVMVDRPKKRQRNQIQQSSVDTSQTQKIGNTRIVVENVNGELKLQIRMLNVLIPCNQFPIISKIVRIGYLLQNFKLAIIQDVNPADKTPEGGRPCRAEIRWYGASDVGLRDVRDNVRLWGLKVEIDRHAELTAQFPEKSPTDISEMVLAERWDLKLRKELYREVHDIEYDGGDL